MRKNHVNETLPMTRKQLYIIIAFVLIPLLPIFLFNPATAYISDGWWHFSVFNSVNQNTLPPPNPWLNGATVAYPYVHHVLTSAVFGQTNLQPQYVFIFMISMVSIVFSCGMYAIARLFYTPVQSLWASFTFYLVSSIGSLLFVWDFMHYAIQSNLIPGFTEFLFARSGPHMWHAGMKFINPAGIGVIFNGSAMVGTSQFLLMIICAYFFLKEEYVPCFMAYAGIITSNPIMGIIYAISLGLYGFWRGWKTTIIIAVGGIAAALVSGSYLISLISKLGNISSSALDIFSPAAGWGFVLFVVGYAPLIVLAGLQIQEKKYPKPAVMFFATYIVANLAIALALKLGYLYVSMSLFLPLALLAGPQFAKITSAKWSIRIVLAAILVVGVSSSLLNTATYSYYKYNLNQDEIAASKFLKENSLPSDVVLINLGDLGVRNIFVYPSVFAARQVYVADAFTIEVYGEEFSAQKAAYDTFWATPSCANIPSPVNYIYERPNGPELSSLNCLKLLYNENNIRIYRVETAE